jgi:hypothetical protein
MRLRILTENLTLTIILRRLDAAERHTKPPIHLVAVTFPETK